MSLAGGAILADGRVGLILDVPGLFELSENYGQYGEDDPVPPFPESCFKVRVALKNGSEVLMLYCPEKLVAERLQNYSALLTVTGTREVVFNFEDRLLKVAVVTSNK